ncbi:hypothetical protein CK203_085631 [Vitis vinifera]|uniref:Uncharacterized protein n=1 Tax=Vitis vinifera TaxID=29760 RepID=A0A438BWE6_VITVI|nr:hypothetical protein CK203_085631 [Vitis vinifera]
MRNHPSEPDLQGMFFFLTLYDVENGISRELWSDSSPVDAKEKKPVGRQRSNLTSIALPYDYAYLPSTLALSCYTAQGVERPLAFYPILVQPCYAAQVTVRPPAHSLDLKLHKHLSFCFKDT